MPVLETCWGAEETPVLSPRCPHPGVVPEVAQSLWHRVAHCQPAWRVLVVFLRTPLCFQLICFDISSRQEVLCVGVRGSAM